MGLLQACKSFDFGAYRRQHDGAEYVVSAVSYVPQRDDDDWQYIFLVNDPIGGRQAFDCFICHATAPTREDADMVAANEVLERIHALIEQAVDAHVPTAAKGSSYYVILPTRHRNPWAH